MDKRIQDFTGIIFRGIPYSEEFARAREEIISALSREYEKLAEEKYADEAMEELIGTYSRLSDLAILAGYPAEAAKEWRSAGDAALLRQVKKELGRQRRKIYLLSLLWLAAGFYLVEIPLIRSLYPLIFAVLFGCIAFLYQRGFRKKERILTANKRYDMTAYRYLRTLSDKYAKRSLNGIALLFAGASIFIFLELSFFLSGNSKLSELLENIYANIIVIEVPAYLCIKNCLCVRLVQRRIALPDAAGYQKHLTGLLLFSASYWLVAVPAVLFFGSISGRRTVNLLLVEGVVFSFLILLHNLTIRKKLTYRNIAVNRKRIAVIVSACVLFSGYMLMRKDNWYTQPYINSIPVVGQGRNEISYDESTGVYTITASSEDFKILHLTDIHLGGSLYSYRKDRKALKAVYAEIAYTKPDLVIVTGDLTFPLGVMSLSLNNSAPVSQFAAFMRNTGIPWAFTYGNHDTESLATLSRSDLNELYQSLSYKTSGNLLYPYVQPEITGRNNQLIELRDSDGTLRQALFLIDSNAYTGEGINVYDYIRDDQVEWYASEVRRLSSEAGHTIPSMVFFHIPLQQYRIAYELYEQGSDEVTYFFGENGEKMRNKVCCSDYPSRLFDRMLELGSTKAVFCGHDHYNNMSLEYKGIRLTYGMSIDYLAMPGIEDDTAQRGAELITIHADGSWELEQIPLESIVSGK